MISYRQFRKLYETDAVVPPAATTTATPAPTAPNIEDVERQIDALFDELKERIRQMYTPRNDWLSRVRAFGQQLQAQNKTEHVSLLEFHRLNEFYADFQEALDASDLALIDKVVDEYKGKYKQIIATYKQQVAATAPAARKPRKKRPAEPAVEPVPAASGPTPAAVEPEPAAPVDTTTVPVPEPKPVPTASAVPEPKPEPEAAPASATVTEPGALSPEDSQLMVLGAKIAYWHDSLGMMDDPSEEEIASLDDEFADYDPKKHMDDKDELIKMAREYQASSGTGAPMKGSIETKPGESPVAPAAESHAPTREQLLAMKDEDFKRFIIDNDPQMEEMYEGEEWWKRRMRKEVVDNFLLAQKDKKESVLHRCVEKYKTMLRLSERPQFLMQEAVRLPLGKRVDFFRKKLSCRGT